jgi:hypothetical protein
MRKDFMADLEQTEQVPNVIYYSKVGLEVAKIVVRGQKMSPP